jgi:hypothetical protein
VPVVFLVIVLGALSWSIGIELFTEVESLTFDSEATG